MGLPCFFCVSLRLGSFQPVGPPVFDFRVFVFKPTDCPFACFRLSVFEDRCFLCSASIMSAFSVGLCLDFLSGVCLWNNFFLTVSFGFFLFSRSSFSFRIRSNSGVAVATIAFPRFLLADLADLGGAYTSEDTSNILHN